ncbi:MAG: PLDc N-terminal domain-containing protein [Phycisphaerae bacterium]|nr:PLDc N-terminal domain-containing protein [Phycisphaerae bacterium]MBN8596271.1 PLDc N-terminal domain-containing protein [Planctomycetota bacterium]
MYIGGSLVGLIILILDLIAIVEILQSGRAVGEKLLWILLILLLPLVGVLLYFLIGRK